jgi:hypothetical protein
MFILEHGDGFIVQVCDIHARSALKRGGRLFFSPSELNSLLFF